MCEEAFLRAIRANPEDDLPRLILADWLDEQGEAKRAETLRWFLGNPQYRQANPIQSAIPGWPEVDRNRFLPSCVFNRGFVSEVSLPLAGFLSHAKTLATLPLQRVTLTDKEPLEQLQRVTLTDKEPLDQHGHTYWWVYSMWPNTIGFPEGIPSVLWWPGSTWFRRFPSRQDALDALSARCLEFLLTLR